MISGLVQKMSRLQTGTLSSSAQLLFAKTFFKGAIFVFTIMAARKLNLSDFGDFQIVNNLINIIVQPSVVLTLILTRKACSFSGQDFLGGVKDIYDRFYFKSLRAAFVAAALLALLGWYFLDVLNVHSPAAFIFGAGSVLFFVAANFHFGLLQALEDFQSIAITFILFGIICIGLAYPMGSHFGTSASFILSQTMAGLIGFVYLDRKVAAKLKPVAHSRAAASDFSATKYFSAMCLSMFSFFLLYNLDVIWIKHILDRDSAGNFAQINFLGKITFIASSALVSIFFPKTSKKASSGQATTRDLVGGSIFFFLQSLVLAACIYVLAPILFTIFFKRAVLDRELLLPLLLASVMQAQLFFLLHYIYAKALRGIWLVPVFAMTIQALFFVFWGHDANSTAWIEFGAAASASFLIYLWLPVAQK